MFKEYHVSGGKVYHRAFSFTRQAYDFSTELRNAHRPDVCLGLLTSSTMDLQRYLSLAREHHPGNSCTVVNLSAGNR
ncbi:hypothetical protein M8J76_017134 [Diaphorina citri]|nr:hypothetical protein M8J76_017134 [Diaphorina citri]